LNNAITVSSVCNELSERKHYSAREHRAEQRVPLNSSVEQKVLLSSLELI